jgi:hypothetical protein
VGYINCPGCKQELLDVVNFCPHCGFLINSEYKPDPPKLKIPGFIYFAAVVVMLLLAITMLGTGEKKENDNYHVPSLASNANPGDMNQAREFLAKLPPACQNSKISTESDGTVVIWLRCNNGTNAIDGLVKIKNGIVTEVR